MEEIKNINIKETVIANLTNVLDLGFKSLILFSGLKVLNQLAKIGDQYTLTFGLIILTYIMMKYANLRLIIAYNLKNGGLIRYD